jgi:hypothetical protein
MPTKGMKDVTGRITFGDSSIFEGPITDFTYDPTPVQEYIHEQIHKLTPASLSFKVPINTWTLFKVCGLWDWVITNCPNKRVVYLMQHGSYRTRNKNWHRAIAIIGKMCTEVKQ